jgi:hypothetical protein
VYRDSLSNFWSRIGIEALIILLQEDDDLCTGTRVQFCGWELFLLREENDRCTRIWDGLSHKLFLLQEDDDLCTGTRYKYLVANLFYCGR